jgi:hypothetical protein
VNRIWGAHCATSVSPIHFSLDIVCPEGYSQVSPKNNNAKERLMSRINLNKFGRPIMSSETRQLGIPGIPPTLNGGYRASLLPPLSAEEAERALQVAGRLQAVLRTLVGTLPEHARGASGMSRYLSIVRSTCQRGVSVVSEPTASVGMLTRLPGVKGLRRLVEGFRAIGTDSANIASAHAAIDQLELLIKDLAGSQTKLADRINANALELDINSAVLPARSAELARKQLFASAVEVMGRQIDVRISLYAFRLHPDNSDTLERVLVTGRIGQLARIDAMPFSFRAGDTQQDQEGDRSTRFATLDDTPAHGSTPNAILRSFSTDPLPLVTSRGSDGQLVQIIDRASSRPSEPIDLVLANRSTHPAMVPNTNQPTLDEVWSLINYPARHLIFDVYLHRNMERLYRPSVDAQLWGPKLDLHPADRWLTRFSHGPRLVVLGNDLHAAHTDAYPRHVELTRYLFQRVGWPIEEFVGFRCEVAYPIWRSGYCMSFEYTTPPGSPSPHGSTTTGPESR